MNNTSQKVDFDTELKTTKFPDFKALVVEFKTISADAQRLNARKNSPCGIFDFYRLLKKVTKPLYEIFNNKSNSKKSIRNLKESINYLNILIRETLAEGLVQFKKQLEKLQELIISLFPKGEAFQLSLFDVEYYTDNKQQSAFQGFLDWLKDVKVLAWVRLVMLKLRLLKLSSYRFVLGLD